MSETSSQSNPSVASTAAILVGCFSIGGGILYPVFAGFTVLPFCLSVVVGLVVGVPAVALGMKLDPNHTEGKPFWPSRESFRRFGWDVLSVGALIWVPVVLAPTFWLIPAGDSWLLAIARVALITFYFAATYAWMTNCPPLLGKWFRGRASDSAVDELEKLFQASEAKPFKLWSAFCNCVGIFVIAAIAFSIVFGFVDFNDKWLQMDAKGPRRFRGLARILMWVRGNPNSTWSTSLLVGIGSVGALIYQVFASWQSWRRTHGRDADGQEV